MSTANCMKCRNRVNRRYPDDQSYEGDCAFGMRFASTAGGSEPSDLRDVHWCRDFEEDDGNEEDW